MKARGMFCSRASTVLALTLLACARSVPHHEDGPQLANASKTPQPLVVETSGAFCPLALPGTTVAFATTPGGASMLFGADDASLLEDLRERVRVLAKDHNRASYRLAMLDLPYHADMVPIAGGARLDLVTGIGNDTLELQRLVETRGAAVFEGRCYAQK
jgi:hypothetical protein